MKSLCTLCLIVAIGNSHAKEIDYRAEASAIDALVEQALVANQQVPNSNVTDEVFVRRAHLQIIGRIPTASEARQFFQSADPNKRSALINSLLASPGFSSHEFNFWADILRIRENNPGQDRGNGVRYAHWVRNAIEANLPYDKFVSKLITADGLIDSNGAVGFYLRDRGMPLDHLATTVQVFLGTQMVCAQCHDHPFDEWTQMDYYKLAAFSTPVDTVRSPDALDQIVRDARNEMQSKAKNLDRNERRSAEKHLRDLQRGLTEFTVNFRNSVIGETQRELKLPHDYKYEDAKPLEVVPPATPFGEILSVEKGESRIQKYADWMTSRENPQFSKVIANRLWKRVMGVGIFEPVDKVGVDDFGSHPALMKHLTKLIQRLDFDQQEFYRILYHTKTWQRKASVYDPLSGEVYRYPGPTLRRMSSEQIWDSIVALVNRDVDSAKGRISKSYTEDSGREEAWLRLSQADPRLLSTNHVSLSQQKKRVDAAMKSYSREVARAISEKDEQSAQRIARELAEFDQRETEIYANLTFWDSKKIGSNRYFRTPFRNQPEELHRQLKNAFPRTKLVSSRNQGEKKSKMTEAERLRANRSELQKKLGKDGYAQHLARANFLQNANANFIRASEIGLPAPENHFLQVFGQSDRELIENSSDEPNIPQALKLMNGNSAQMIASPHSVLGEEIAQQNSLAEKCEVIFLSLLGRKPSETERETIRVSLVGQSKSPVPDLIWAILNSQQFIYIE